MSMSDAYAESQRLNRLLDAGVDALREHSKTLAAAERDYRKAKAEAWVRCPRDEAGERDWTAARREAWVNSETADLRYQRDICDGMRDAAREAVRARRQQLSTLQTFVAAERSEMELAR